MAFNVDWNILVQTAEISETPWWEYLLGGVGWTVLLSICSLIVALIIGVIVGALRTVDNKRIQLFCICWTEMFRNIPLLVQMFLWYFVVPEFIPPMKAWMISTEPIYAQFLSAFLCLGLFTSARVAEQVRAGIQSLRQGQTSAGLALGLTRPQTYCYVLLPMAMRIIIPPLTSETMNLVKNTSIALTIGLAEITFRAHEMGEYTFQFFVAFSYATVVYFIISSLTNRVMGYLEKKLAIPGYIGR